MTTNDLVAVVLVPVEVFGGDCACHEKRELGEGKTDCHGWAYGLCDAVQAWSDCNRADGRIYRVDDDANISHRQPGETVTVYVPRDQLPWFERVWGDGK